MNDFTMVGSILSSVQASGASFSFPINATGTENRSKTFFVFQKVKDTITNIIFARDCKLEYLGSYTFYSCTKISTINLSLCKNLHTIHDYCFAFCSNLQNVILADDGTVTSLKDYCFANTAIVSFHLPSSITSLGLYVFNGCGFLDTITTVKDVKFETLWTCSFSGSGLKHFIIPKAVKSVSGSSLMGTQVKYFEIDQENPYLEVVNGNLYSKNLENFIAAAPLATEVNFIPNCTRIAGRAFLFFQTTEVFIPKHVCNFGAQTFYGSNIYNITITNCESIPSMMFLSCSGLTVLTLPPNLLTIGSEFISITNIAYLFIPKSVVSITDAFVGCRSDLFIDFENGSCFSFENGFLYDNKKIRIHVYTGSSEYIEIVDTIEAIDGSAFASKSSIKTIIFRGSKIKSIGKMAFSNLQILQSIELPKSVITLGESCFKGSGFVNFTIPGSVESIPQYCFQDCLNLANLTVMEGVSTIEEKAFQGCIKLTDVKLPSTITQIGSNSFSRSGLISMHIPSAVLEIKSSAFSECQFHNVTFPEATVALEETIFKDCTSLQFVDLSLSKIEVLPTAVFEGCINLITVYFPSNILEIGNMCFSNCGFRRFVIPSTVKTIGSESLGNNPNLVSVSLSMNTALSTVVSTSFRGSKSLKEFECDGKSEVFESIDGVLVNKIDHILCAYPPARDTQYEIYIVPPNIRAIGPSAFLDSKLKEIVMKEEVINIGANAFMGCNNLKKLVFQSETISVGPLSFAGLNFGCGLFEGNLNVRELLVQVGEVPQIAVEACPTFIPNLILVRNLALGCELLEGE